jgi:flagellar biosynthetic protein FlhB
MADQESDQDDKTEDATPERRDDFREKGQVVASHELSQVLALAAIIGLFSWYGTSLSVDLQRLLRTSFESITTTRLEKNSLLSYLSTNWVEFLKLIAPAFLVAGFVSGFVTLLQTQFNWSWKKLEFDWKKLNPITGIGRLFQMEVVVGGLKSTAKMFVVGVVAWLILYGEWNKVPSLLYVPFSNTWTYWGIITSQLFWGVVALMLLVAGGDYVYSFVSMERKMRMTKQEVKEELKQRESDPHVKARLRKMARDIATKKTVENTRKATVVITNPTHYSVAVRYELGMAAPLVVAKGVDFLALRMREVAKELDIPIVENKALARALYASVTEGSEVPGEMYKAIAEIIRFVFKLKNVKVPAQVQKSQTSETRAANEASNNLGDRNLPDEKSFDSDTGA